MITDEWLWVIDYTFHLRFTMFPCVSYLFHSFFLQCKIPNSKLLSWISSSSTWKRTRKNWRNSTARCLCQNFWRDWYAWRKASPWALSFSCVPNPFIAPSGKNLKKFVFFIFMTIIWVGWSSFSLRLQFHGLNAWLFRNVVVCVSSPIGRKSPIVFAKCCSAPLMAIRESFRPSKKSSRTVAIHHTCKFSFRSHTIYDCWFFLAEKSHFMIF